MDETALVVLVFDGQKEEVFETLGQWDRDLTRASRKAFAKLLAAGRVDLCPLRVSRSQVEAFMKERGFASRLFETSAKVGTDCEALKPAILGGIRWEGIPWRFSPLLFKRLKEEIIRLKDAGRVLMRFNELRETLQLRLSGEFARFTDDELKAVVSLLGSPGVVWELKFGSWLLLQPERINAYAQAVIQTMRADEHERGCLPVVRVLNGDLTYHSSMKRLEADEERFVLLAMHQTLVERGLCLRAHTDKGALLIFPSYYRRERPDLVGHPAVLVSYRFNGFLDDIYSTLVVRLHHTKPFQQDQLWRYAADFRTTTGKKLQLGVKQTRRAEGEGELEVYSDPAVTTEEKIIFSEYVHEHLLKNARDVVRLRHYVCPHCGTPVGNREVAMRKLGEGKKALPPPGHVGRRGTCSAASGVPPDLGRVLWSQSSEVTISPPGGHPMYLARIRFPLALGLLLALVGAPLGLLGGPAEGPATREEGPRHVELRLQTRDPKNGQLRTRGEAVDPHKVAVIVIDPWNYHWCMTWSEQAGGMVPRLNQALRAARKLGMQVLWAPTDVASMYAGVSQRERALAVPYDAVPSVRASRCAFTVASGPCHCGPGVACLPNYGHDGMPPDIDLAESDLIVSGTQEVYSSCKHRGITHLIYAGGAINLCLTGKPEGLTAMHEAGLECCVARDLAEAWTHYDPAKGHTPDVGNATAIADLERAGIPTIHLAGELRRLGLWDDDAVTEPVRITPAGKPGRPFLFEESVIVCLNTPWLSDAEIRYTLDGTAPNPRSPCYEQALVLTRTTTLRAAAFRREKRVSLETSGYWVRLPPMPPAPDVALDQVRPVPDLYAAVNPACAACLWHPKMNQSYEGLPLHIRGRKYDKGVGMRAPAYLRYELKPEWERFVALAGVADNMLDQELGRNIARYPSVVFRVFVDGKQAAESPVMRISQAPWRLDVRLPPGARVLTLAVTDAGDRSPYDLANWVEAGFVRKRTP